VSSSTIGQQQNHQDSINRKPSFFGGIAKSAGGTFLSLTMLTSAIVAGGMVGLAISFRNLPDVRVLRNYSATETTYVYDIKGRVLSSIHGEANRKVVTLDKIAPELKRAVMAIEDSHFYQHDGINIYSIGRAIAVNFKKGGVSEGASTLTMQLVKNLFLSHERTFTRKLAEAVLAVRVEQLFDKNEILELYLNNIYWGHNNYGVQTAAESYFNKSASQLNLAESAMMAGLIQAPESFSPFINLKESKARQALVLERMREIGWITRAQEQAALKQPLKLGKPTAWIESKAPYITEAVANELKERFGNDVVLKGGMRVQTTLDYYYQKQAEEIVANAYRQQVRGRGVRADQIALVAVDPRTHFVKALVGGVNYDKSQFNRAIQARRQPGSSFKPFVYYAAFASGKFTPESIVPDSPIRFREGGGYYSPKNYGGGYAGPMSIRTALAQSRNVPAVWIGQKVGLDKVIAVCRILGIKSVLQPVVSLPLGASDVTPLEMAGGYATFANNGWHSDPTIIVQITDSKGNLVLDNVPQPKLVLDPWSSASMNSILQSVINGGTGKSAALGRPAAGKTGTTSAEKDVWFVGYVPQLSTAVWIGNDNSKSIGRGVTGGGYAAPIWRRFMSQALKNEPVESFTPASKFPRPRGK
jgi:1A family penicillin-binding protein